MSYRLQWRIAFSGKDGPAGTTRLVLHTLSLHMDEFGGSCFPSHRTIALESGIGRNTVSDHLNKAVAAGWLVMSPRLDGAGQAWRGFDYEARIPEAGSLTEPRRG